MVGYHQELAVTTNVLNVFPTRIKIGSGVILALHTDSGFIGCATSGFTATDKRTEGAFNPVTGTTSRPPG